LCVHVVGELLDQKPDVLADLVAKVVNVEGPVHFQEVVKRIRVAWGLKRSGNRINNLVAKAIFHAERQGRVRKRGDFIWSNSTDPVRVRRRNRTEQAKIEFICDEEIAASIEMILRRQFATPPEELVVQASRVFGIKATHATVSTRIGEVMDKLLAKRVLRKLSNGMMDVAMDFQSGKHDTNHNSGNSIGAPGHQAKPARPASSTAEGQSSVLPSGPTLRLGSEADQGNGIFDLSRSVDADNRAALKLTTRHEEFRGLSHDTIKLAIERPTCWEILLFLKALIDEVSSYANLRDALERGTKPIAVENLLLEDTPDWISSRLCEMSSIVQNLGTTLEKDVQVALGPAGKPGDVSAIVVASRKMGLLYKESLDLFVRFKAIRPEPIFTDLFQEIETAVRRLAHKIETYGPTLLTIVGEALSRPKTANPPQVNLAIDFNDLNLKKIEAMLKSRLFSAFGIPEKS